MAKFDKDFQEIAHCGGRYTVQVEVKDDGNLVYSVGYHHRGAGPASFFAVYALREGIVAGTVQLGGIGDQFNDPPHPSCIPIFIASDRTGMFGHRCPQCEQYWRSRGAPSRWPMTCPYCGLLADCHDFRTDGQLKYVEECCGLINDCFTSGQPGTHCVDMDKAADKAQQEPGKPIFYYVEESQQNMYRCDACDEIFDIIGRFAYCPCCGTRNDVCIAGQEIEAIRREILSANSNLGNCVRNLVGVFDIFARSLSRQLVDRVPMTPARRKAWERLSIPTALIPP
jgi:hypothetical protein